MSEHDGYEVPLHKSLTEPVLFAGVPRKLASINAIFSVAIGLGGQSWLAIPIGVGFHIVFAMLTKIDANFFEVLFRNIARNRYWRV